MPGLPVHHQLLEFTQTHVELVMPSSHLILCRLLFLLPLIFPRTRNFSNESVLCIRWPKSWSFSFSISPSDEYSGLISLYRHITSLCCTQKLIFFYLLKKIILFIYLAMLHLHCCVGSSVVAESGGYSPALVHGLLLLWSSDSRHEGSIAVFPRL